MEHAQDFQFILPLRNNDLLNSRGDQYYVQQIYGPNEIPEQLLACKQKLYHGDIFYIFEHFDTYFSIIEPSDNDAAGMRNLMRAFDLLYVTTDKLSSALTSLLGGNEAPTASMRTRFLNLTKMTLYLLVNTVKRIESAVQKAQRERPLNQQKKRVKQPELEQYPDWEVKRGKFLVQLYNVLQSPLEKLWSPPMAEENFVTMLCDIGYRTLELVPTRSDNRLIADTIFQIFGTAIKRYNHAMTFPARIMQILRSAEHAAVAVANGILLLYEEYNIASVFSILIKDIVDALKMDSSDTAVARNFSNFITEFAGIAPKLLMPHLSKLGDDLLDCDSHMLRNCVLQLMSDVVASELTSEQLDAQSKEMRNDFLENLLEHINDVSAHVRAKVLNIWHHLNEQHAIPLSFLLRVLREGVCRLEDKSSLVRKSAIQLIKAFLENNPFAGKLTLDELLEKHRREVLIMEELDTVLLAERKEAEKLDEQWVQISGELMPIIEEHLKEMPEMHFDREEEYEALVQRITALLLQKSYKEAIVLVRKADFVAGNEDLSTVLSLDERCVYFLALFKTFISVANGCKDSSENMARQIKTVEFLKDSIEFAKVVSNAMPKMLEMLMSKTNTDVFEAVDLFTTGYQFGIRGTEAGMQRMLCLVWSADKEKRDAVSQAYSKVLFTTDQLGRGHAIKVVQNLSKFLAQIEYGHYTALESLIVDWVATEQLDALTVQVLFERLTLKLPGTSKDEARLALQLLVMASRGKATIVTANRALIEGIATGPRVLSDPRIYASCLQLLVNGIDANSNAKYYRRHHSHSRFVQQVTGLFLGYFFQPALPDFDGLAMSLFEYYYKMCQSPDLLATHVILEVLRRIKAKWLVAMEPAAAPAPTQTEDIPFSQPMLLSQTQTQSQPPTEQFLPCYLLSRFIYCIGCLTIKEMIFLDMDVYNNMKYREELTALEEKSKKEPANQLPRQTINVSAMEVRKRLSGVASEPQQEPDDDLVGATAEDNIAEEINAICEDLLLYEPNALLAQVYPIIIGICKRPGEYRDQHLQQSATLALARLMTVSSKFCEANMSFLMNILTMTKNIKIKCNTVVGLSDLTFRFPNIIEPWTGHFYSQLHESNTELRLTAVKMVSHLILHEMIRVKGQIADLALCIVDEHDEIRNITQQFFKEIANKSNILYNVLPDIISKLGDVNLKLEEDKYRTIMRYILGLIQKDRQIETLVEKLCMRFPVSRAERQWRDIAYCLSLLTYNERSIKKLIDNVQQFKDKVQVDEVYQSFKLIISNTSKLAKPELKAAVTEFETRLHECLEPAGSPSEDTQSADKTESRPNQTKRAKSRGGKQQRRPAAARKRGNTTRRRSHQVDNSSDEASDNESNSSETDDAVAGPSRKQQASATPAARGKNRTAVRQRNSFIASDDDTSPEKASTSQRRRGRK